MFENLQAVEARFEEMNILLSQPETIQDQDKWRKLMREHSEIQPVVEAYRRYTENLLQQEESQLLLSDPEMHDMAQEELAELKEKEEELVRELRLLLIPKDPNDERNVIMEIRGGAGGEEAALFGAELLRMYTHFAESHGWRMEVMDGNITELGGVKEASCMIYGKGAYSLLKYESGVHRVQRVPDTESSGRIHTSTTTVAVLPEVDDVDVEIRPEDLKIDTYRASGAGGQHVNRTDSAVRITHLPTGIVVQCQNERSQIQNREQCMRMLRAKLMDKAVSEQHDSVAADRRSQVGTGDRSERIRTYNYPQGRVTDHRIGLTLYKLDSFLAGDMNEMLNALIVEDQSQKLKKLEI